MKEKQKKELCKEILLKQIAEVKSGLFLDDFLNEIEFHLNKCWSFKDISKSEKQQKYLLIRAKQLNTIRQNLLGLQEIIDFITSEDVFTQCNVIPDLNNVLHNFYISKELSALKGNFELYRKLVHIDAIPIQYIEEYRLAT
jgi:hypothetical protein